MFQLYFSQVGAHQSMPAWSWWYTAIFWGGNEYGRHSSNQQTTRDTSKSTACFPVRRWRFVIEQCSGLSSITVACQCPPQKKKKDPVVTAFNFSSVNTTEHTQTGMCCYSHSAPYQSDSIPANRFFFFFLIMRDMQVFCFGTQRQASRSTTVNEKIRFFEQEVWSLPARLSLLLTKTDFLYLTPLALALLCIHIYNLM